MLVWVSDLGSRIRSRVTLTIRAAAAESYTGSAG